MSQLLQQTEETVAYIRSKTGYKPEIAIVLGSGLGQLGEQLQHVDAINYKELPHWKSSTAPGHNGRLLFGLLDGKEVVCMQGRLHYYEGYSMEEITYPVRVMARLGVKNLLLSNAAGGINLDFAPGDLMLITDHINFMGKNPLMGPNEDAFGVRFCDMSYAYQPSLRKIALEAAQELGQNLQQGVYVATTGPSYETPAEIKMFRSWGASAVGCLQCRKQLRQITAESMCWEFPALPIWPPVFWINRLRRKKFCSPEKNRALHSRR